VLETSATPLDDSISSRPVRHPDLGRRIDPVDPVEQSTPDADPDGLVEE
jgi:hypothetical protein